MFLVFVLLIVLLFGVSVFVHELGHFLVARALGLQATVFSIGMGPAVWKRQCGPTRLQIGCLPLGGFVALPQMDPNSFLESPGGAGGPPATEDLGADPPPVCASLPPVPPWKKLLVAVAGAAGNLVFALVLATVVWIVGRPASLQESSAVVGWVDPSSPAAAAGVVPGDAVTAVNGAPVRNWPDIATAVALSPSPAVTLDFASAASPGTPLRATLAAVESTFGGYALADIDGPSLCHVAEVYPSSPAAAAGLRPGDLLLAYDGRPLHSRAQLSQLVEANATNAAPLVYSRSGVQSSVTLAAAWNPDLERHLIGVGFNTLGDLDYAHPSHPTPFAQLSDHFRSIAAFLRALVTPSTARSAGRAVGGPVSIFVMLYLMVKTSFVLAVWFTGFLNVNLAVINLLPLPLLDGGHVVFALWAWLTRRPVPARVVAALTNVFAVLFIVLFLFLTTRDTARQIVPAIRNRLATPSASP